MSDESVADRIVGVVRASGVNTVFGLPGEDHLSLLESLHAAQVRYVAAANESSAVVMAATSGIRARRCGFVVLSMAPGISNGMNGLAHAYSEQLPVVVISGRQGQSLAPFVVRQGLPGSELVRPVVKWTSSLTSSADPSRLVIKAIEVAMRHPAGPVYLEMPDEWMRTAVATQVDPAILRRFAVRLQQRDDVPRTVDVSSSDAAWLRQRLAAARRPAVIVGGAPDGAQEELKEALGRFVCEYQCPVLVTPRRIGTLRPESPWFAGCFLNGAVEHALLDSSDLLLAFDLDGMDTYNTPWLYAETVGVSANGRSYLYDFERDICASPHAVLAAMSEPKGGALTGESGRWQQDDVKRYRDHVSEMLLAAEAPAFGVVSAVEVLLKAMPAGATVVADAGFSKPILLLLGGHKFAGRFLASNGLSTMGFGIPAGIAWALEEEGPVVVVTGDGSAVMRITELAFHRRVVGPLVVVVIADGALTQIRVKQQLKGLHGTGVELPSLEWGPIAAALGVKGVDVFDRESAEQAIVAATNGIGVTVIGVHVDTDSASAVFDVVRG